jgi:hypothetical protein
MLDRLGAGEVPFSVASIDSSRGNLNFDKRLVTCAV